MLTIDASLDLHVLLGCSSCRHAGRRSCVLRTAIIRALTPRSPACLAACAPGACTLSIVSLLPAVAALQVNRGQKLGEHDGSGFGEMTVEDLLEVSPSLSM